MLDKIMRIVLILLMLWSLCFPKEESAEDPLHGLTGGSYQSWPVGRQAKFRFPETVFKTQEVIGSYSKEEINAVADNSMLCLNSIYYKYLSKNLGFEGNVLLKFTIAGSGEASNIDILSSTTGNTEFDEAVKKEFSTWKWNVKNGSTMVTILLKFIGIYKSQGYIISGPRLGSEIISVLSANMPKSRNIYRQKYLKLKPGFDGEIVIRFTIAGSGEVINADIVASTTEYAEFDEAIKKEFYTWKWKPIEKGNATVTAIFSFKE